MRMGAEEKNRHRSMGGRPWIFPAALLCGFGSLGDGDLDIRSYVTMQFDRNGELAKILQRLNELDLAAIEVEAASLELSRDVGTGDRSEQVIVFAGATREVQADSIELLR